MPQVTLHVLDGGVVLHVGGRGAPERLECHPVNTSSLRHWFQVPLQVVPNTEGGSGRVWEQKRTRIIVISMPCDPSSDLATEIRWHGNVAVALSPLCGANPIFPFLALFQGLVNSELRALEVLNPQHEDFGWPQAADGKNPDYKMLARWRLSKDCPKLVHAQKALR
jgi:hypothetical protein